MRFEVLDYFTDKNNYLNYFDIGREDMTLMMKLVKRDVALNREGYKKHGSEWINSHPHSKFVRLFTGVTPETKNFSELMYSSKNPAKMIEYALKEHYKRLVFIPDGFVDAIRASHSSYDKSDTVLVEKMETNYAIDDFVYFMKIEAPLFLWKQIDTYHRGLISLSESTMYCLHKNKLCQSNFSLEINNDTLIWLNKLLRQFEVLKSFEVWRRLINDLPSGYLQTRFVMLTRSTVMRMISQRSKHKLTEWRWLAGQLEEMLHKC